jgi:hypothetical protein
VEFLGEILALVIQAFAEVCCEAIFVAGMDAFVGVSAFKARQANVRARAGGRAAAADTRIWTFWVLLPVALVLTALLVWSMVARRS